MKKSSLKVILCSFLWLLVGVTNSHASPATVILVTGDFSWETHVEEGVFSGVGSFQRSQRISVPSVYPEQLPDFIFSGNFRELLNYSYIKTELQFSGVDLQDQRYTLVTKIFPFHFFL